MFWYKSVFVCPFTVEFDWSWLTLIYKQSGGLSFPYCTLQYLKEQRLPPQTFIPLQSVRVKPIIERLRTLGGTAKLIFDVIQYPFPKLLLIFL